MEPDLSRTITMHPHVFQMQSQSAGAVSAVDRSASSTGVEAVTPESDRTIARHPSAALTDDVEVESQMQGRLPLSSLANDPYRLSTCYKSPTELEDIKANTSRKRNPRQTTGNDAGATSAKASGGGADYGLHKTMKMRLASCLPYFGRQAVQAQRLQGFYQNQNETIERLLKTVEEHRLDARHEEGEDQLKYRVAVWGSFAANVALAGLQLYGAISSGSLSLFTTMADAIFDPMSNLTLIITNNAVRKVDPARFPSGKARLETVGNIVFCFLMTAVSFILIAFSARELAQHAGDAVNSFHLPSVVAVCCAFATKLVLFLYTWSIKDKYSQVNILWQDHRNDLLINGFGILTSVGGSKLSWWIDPAGAILISIIISTIWLSTAFGEFMLLVGVVSGVEVQQLITYVCVTHSPAIRQIDTVRVYHAGPRLIAEVDVVMDPEATLKATHDVAEELQFKLESLPDVERAYVHVDYETTHKPEHAFKKDL